MDRPISSGIQAELIDCTVCNGSGGTGPEEICERCRGTGQVLARKTEPEQEEMNYGI